MKLNKVLKLNKCQVYSVPSNGVKSRSKIPMVTVITGIHYHYDTDDTPIGTNHSHNKLLFLEVSIISLTDLIC